MTTPRLRVFAGPNGSGKSTLAQWLARDYAVNLYHHINADTLFAEIDAHRMTACPLEADTDALRDFALRSTYPDACKRPFRDGRIRVEREFVVFERDAISSYTVALLADFYRHAHLARGDSFSFETVLSHPGKTELIREARQSGYRTYLYFVATESPDINLCRVAARVCQGGHDVPPDKLVERFGRCLRNAAEALPWLSRAYFFDNSGDALQLVAEFGDGHWQLGPASLPHWFGTIAQPMDKDI